MQINVIEPNTQRLIDYVLYLATEEELMPSQILELQGLVPKLIETLTDKIQELDQGLTKYAASDKEQAAIKGWNEYISR